MQLVYVRGYQGEVKRMALLAIEPPIARVCLEGEYEAIQQGRKAPPIFGYRLTDVFESAGLERSLHDQRERAHA